MHLLKMIGVALAAIAVPSASFADTRGKVLVLLSSQTTLALKDGRRAPTGYYLNEFGVPADALLKAGYELVIVTPKGNVPAVDASSLDASYFHHDADEMQRVRKVVDGIAGMRHPLSLRQVLGSDMSQYAGVFVPGGHAPLIDLANNAQVGDLLRYFHSHGVPTAAICHGPAALLSAQSEPAAFEAAVSAGKTAHAHDWIYAGYRMTVFSEPEEKVYEQSLNGGRVRYYPSVAMRDAGGTMDLAPSWQSHVVEDRELITGQNPFSDDALAKAFVSRLNARANPATAKESK